MWRPNMETKMDANVIVDMNTNLKNLNREMYAIMERTTIQAQKLEKVIKEQSSRQLLSDIKNDDIQETESISLSLENDLSSSTLDEDKITMKYEKMSLILDRESQDPTLVEKNELVIEEELLLKENQVEKQHLELIMENVLVGVEDFYFPIESLTFGMKNDRQVSFVEKPSIATSQMWIDAENGKMTLLVGKEKMKFDLHQTIPLTDEERRACKKLESSFPLIKEQAPIILQEDTLEGYKFEANSFSSKELTFELTSPILEVEEVILTSNEDEERVLATMDEGPKQIFQTSPMSLAGL